MECGKCSSRHAAIRNISSSDSSLKLTMDLTTGMAFVSVPVLSNTMVVASATASMYLPPLTMMSCSPASLIAESTVTGIASFNAQEKSTIRTASALVAFLVRSHTSAVPSNVYGTSLSARCSAWLSDADFSLSVSSIMDTIFSYFVDPLVSLTRMTSSPSSTTVPAYA